MLDSVVAVVTDPGDVDLLERIGVLAAAGEASPHARGLILVELHTWLDWLEGWLRRRLRPDVTDSSTSPPSPPALVGAAEAAFRVWLRCGTPADAVAAAAADGSASFRDCFTAAIGHVRTGLDPQRVTVAARTA